MRARIAVLFVWVGLLLPGAANACSVCFSATEENRIAFLLTTIFLSGLPLFLVGGLIWWLRRRALQLQRSHPQD